MRIKKLLPALFGLVVCLLLLTGCQTEEETYQWDRKPAVMVDGVLYGDTSVPAVYRTKDKPQNGGRVDGTITSTVSGSENPREDDQSNFGAGFPYRFEEDGSLAVYFEDANKWILFKPYDD